MAYPAARAQLHSLESLASWHSRGCRAREHYWPLRRLRRVCWFQNFNNNNKPTLRMVYIARTSSPNDETKLNLNQKSSPL